VLIETLRAMGAYVQPYIPSREDEGYGLNREAIQTLAEEGVRLLITVDCGIRSLDEVGLARHLGMHVIVTDHHHVGDALPQADAVINPKRPQSQGRFSDLAGVGVAYKLAQGLIRTNQQVPLPTTQRELAEDELLDLVALGTVADMVALMDENHRLVARGLEKINRGHRPGLSALMRITDVEPGNVTTKTISFVLAPRLNAAGRLDEAMTALDLLLAPDMARALPLAEALDTLNQTRRDLTQDVHERARDVVTAQHVVPPLLFAASPDFPAGVVGLAASRLLDEFYRPAIVVAVEGEYSKGSARSIPEFHVTRALDMAADLLVRHGGHAAAAGFTVRTSQLEALEARLLAITEEHIGDLALAPTLAVDAEIPLRALSWDLYDRLEQLQPFGYGNPVPVFASRRVRVLSARAVGKEGRHLKLYVADESGRSWDAIAFRQGYWIGRLPTWVDLAYVLEKNEWNGRISLQLNVQDIHTGDEDLQIFANTLIE
jgi:single-stranded-DNA-specific exonuclease